MSLNAELLKQAQTAELEDQTVVKVMGPRLPEAGIWPARLVGLIELGTHPQEFQGTATAPAPELQLVFEVFGKPNMQTFEKDGKSITTGTTIRPLPMTVKQSAKATFMKVLDKLRYGRKDIKHIGRMIGEVFRLKIEIAESNKGTKFAKIVDYYSPIIDIVDPDSGEVTGTKDITPNVPPPSRDMQLFLFDTPTFEQWKSIEIEGTYTRKTKDEDGKEIEEEVSKNFIQEKIQSALNWEGSPMQTLLLGLDEDEGEVEEPTSKKQEGAKKKSSTAPSAKEKQAKKVPTTQTSVNTADDAHSNKEESEEEAALAELGL